MPEQTRVVSPHYKPRTVRFDDGSNVEVPEGWELLPTGDAGLTRRVKAGGPSWTVQEKKGRKIFGKGVWAPAENIERAKADVEAERATPAYKKKMEAARVRREKAQAAYVLEFGQAVRDFLAFHETHQDLEATLAEAVAILATPVGSGTVARTKRIPVEERAEAAVIAWMRHQTTAYDHIKIPRVKGKRRQVRAQLARESRQILHAYRRGESPADDCPLWKALHA